MADIARALERRWRLSGLAAYRGTEDPDRHDADHTRGPDATSWIGIYRVKIASVKRGVTLPIGYMRPAAATSMMP